MRSARRPSTSCASGHTVSAYVRSPGKVPAGWGADVTVVVGEITDAAAIDRAVAGADAVVSALGRLGFNVTAPTSPASLQPRSTTPATSAPPRRSATERGTRRNRACSPRGDRGSPRARGGWLGAQSPRHAPRSPPTGGHRRAACPTASVRETGEALVPYTYVESFDAGTVSYRAAVSSMRAGQSGNLWRGGATRVCSTR